MAAIGRALDEQISGLQSTPGPQGPVGPQGPPGPQGPAAPVESDPDPVEPDPDPEAGSEFTYTVNSLVELEALQLKPGESAGLMRGALYAGFLRIPETWVGTADNPITIGAYGEGERPVIQCDTSDNVLSLPGPCRHVIIQDLDLYHTEAAYGGKRDDRGDLYGFVNGVVVNAQDCTIQRCRIRGNANGILLRDPSRNIKVINNLFYENRAVQTPLTLVNVGVGNSCIQVRGSGHVIDGNVARNNIPPGNPRRNTFLEIFAATNIRVTRNFQDGGRKFTELGSGKGVISRDLLFAYNLHWSDADRAQFVVGRGEGPEFGPVYNTQIINNTIWLTAPNSEAIIYGGQGENLVTILNNIIAAEGKGIYRGLKGGIVEDYNIWFKPSGGRLQLQNHTMGANSKQTDPLLVDPVGRDLRLRTDSPAWDVGIAYEHGVIHDVEGKPLGGPVHIGAFAG